MNARQHLDCGNNYPYEVSDDITEYEETKSLLGEYEVAWAHAAARGIISLLRQRKSVSNCLGYLNYEERIKLVRERSEVIRLSNILLR